MSGEVVPRVNMDDLRWHEGHGLYAYQGVPFTGVAFTIEWGGLTSETQYHGGLRSGTHREWHPNGQLAVEKVGEHGILLREQQWDESGWVVKEYTIKESGPDWQTLELCRKLYGSH